MAKLVYSTICSLDGYVADERGRFDWSVPDEEVHAFVNDLERPIGTYLYGRRMYEVLVAWETMETAGQPSFDRRLRPDLARRREGRLLPHPDRDLERPHPDRARVRPRPRSPR